MLLAVVFLSTLAIFTASLLLAARGSSGADPRMEARFALMQAETAGPATEGAALLKDVPAAAGGLAKLLERMRVTPRLARLSVQADRPLKPERFVVQCGGWALGAGCWALRFCIARCWYCCWGRGRICAAAVAAGSCEAAVSGVR